MIIAAKDFQQKEYAEPKKIFAENGFEVKTASSAKTAVGALGLKVETDLLVSDVKEEDFDALVFVGGPGAEEYFSNEDVLGLARAFDAKEKIVAAICLAPVILGRAKIIKGREITCFPGSPEKLLAELGVIADASKPVIAVENLITGNGPVAAEEFARKIVEKLKNRAKGI